MQMLKFERNEGLEADGFSELFMSLTNIYLVYNGAI